jgi:CBS domain containing-hemolysin-like protein
MSATALFWLFSTIFWTFVMSFYSMQEMACISFNRLRLEFAVREGHRREKWIKSMLDNPTTLFGTTLIGVNVALVISSESMRRLFEALSLNPNLSPLIQVPYVLIIGELIPMFAARLFPEHMARLGIPLLWISSKLLSPIAKVFDLFFRFLRRLFASEGIHGSPPHLQRDELKDLITVQTRGYIGEAPGQLESIVSWMFTLREKPISQMMVSLTQIPSLGSSALCGPSRDVVRKSGADFALIRNRQGRIIGYIPAFDLVSAPDSASVGSVSRTATFVGESTTTIDVLFRLKKERATLAFVIGSGGNVTGCVAIDDILEELTRGTRREQALFHIEKSLPADLPIHEFIRRYHIVLPATKARTFAALVEEVLGHKPSANESVRFGPLEITVKEVGILGAKTILVKSAE